MVNKVITYKQILQVAFPIIVSSIAQNVVNVTDTAFLGHVGEIELGAAGNSGILYFILVVVGMGITTGGQIIIGRRNGEGSHSEIGKVFKHTLLLVVPFSVFIIAGILLFSDVLLKFIIQSEEIYVVSLDFINYRVLGLIFAYINFSFIAFYVGITKTKTLMLSTIIMMVVNVFLDYSLIFGNFGFPEWGVKGAAIASVSSEVASMLFFISFTYFATNWKKYQLFSKINFQKNIISNILKVGSPISLQNFLSLSSWFAFFVIIEKMGEMELAASHIVRSIYMVLMIPLFGYSNATSTLVSNLIGEGKKDVVLPLLNKIVILSLLTTSIILIFNLIAPEYVISLYTKNNEITLMTLDVLKIINFTMFLFSVAFIYFNGVTGTGNTTYSMLIEFITISIYLVGAYYIALILKSELRIVWCSEFIYFIILGSLSYFYIKAGKWKNKEI